MPFKAYGYVAKFFFVPVPRLTFPVQPAWPFKEPFSDRKTRKTLTTRRGLYIWTRKYLFFRIADATYRGPWVKFAKRYKFVLPLNMQTSFVVFKYHSDMEINDLMKEAGVPYPNPNHSGWEQQGMRIEWGYYVIHSWYHMESCVLWVCLLCYPVSM